MDQAKLNKWLERYAAFLDGPLSAPRFASGFTDSIVAGLSFKGARLDRADCRGAQFTQCDFTDASCADTDLRCAYFTGANLTRANLTGAKLAYATFDKAILTDVIGLPKAPVIKDIDARILEALGSEPGKRLRMKDWHSQCGTAHCRAGWAITLAGKEGAQLADQYRASCAGALIYAASRPGKPIPDFCCDNAPALADLRACAKEQLSGSEEPELPVLYSTIR